MSNQKNKYLNLNGGDLEKGITDTSMDVGCPSIQLYEDVYYDVQQYKSFQTIGRNNPILNVSQIHNSASVTTSGSDGLVGSYNDLNRVGGVVEYLNNFNPTPLITANATNQSFQFIIEEGTVVDVGVFSSILEGVEPNLSIKDIDGASIIPAFDFEGFSEIISGVWQDGDWEFSDCPELNVPKYRMYNILSNDPNLNLGGSIDFSAAFSQEDLGAVVDVATDENQNAEVLAALLEDYVVIVQDTYDILEQAQGQLDAALVNCGTDSNGEAQACQNAAELEDYILELESQAVDLEADSTLATTLNTAITDLADGIVSDETMNVLCPSGTGVNSDSLCQAIQTIEDANANQEDGTSLSELNTAVSNAEATIQLVVEGLEVELEAMEIDLNAANERLGAFELGKTQMGDVVGKLEAFLKGKYGYDSGKLRGVSESGYNTDSEYSNPTGQDWLSNFSASNVNPSISRAKRLAETQRNFVNFIGESRKEKANKKAVSKSNKNSIANAKVNFISPSKRKLSFDANDTTAKKPRLLRNTAIVLGLLWVVSTITKK